MTSPHDQVRPGQPTDASTARTSLALLERLADRLGARVSVTSVYGEPVTRGDITVIPVAEIAFGFGAGAGRETTAAKNGEGGGGGGGAAARPCGFIVIKNDTAVFTPLRNPWADATALFAALLAGAATPRLVRNLIGRRARC
ncbi:GerW family sporulation protein [Streptomyces sp. CB02400]|uniref:GerW family sporulation protein n=1 Tax=Streptomyces sp. CB02400 TaxID=1703944 RepID=UPI000938BC98|nr:spore germination protein GerW family protein [Streptomyces sp. CB02400]OKJ91665.1 hypothetical protein AMK33_35125 [Streptomyces sp. CB02400]